MGDFARYLAPFGGRKIHLRNYSTDETPGFKGRKRARKKLEQCVRQYKRTPYAEKAQAELAKL